MEALQKFRRGCINIAEEYAFIIHPLLKFVIAYLAFSTINAQLGYNTRLANLFIVLAMSLISAVLPNMVMIMLAAVLLIVQSYSVHLFAGIFVVLMLLLLYIFVQRFSGKYGLLLILTPLACQFGLAPAVPVLGGLLLGPSALLPICSGTLIYSMVKVVVACAPTIHEVELKEFTSVVTPLMDGFLQNTDVVLLLIVMASTFLVAYALHRLSVAYAWYIAVGCGVATYLLLLVIGGFFLETTLTIGTMLPGLIVSLAAGAVLGFFCCGLDYRETQRLQFEDDDYYYYVKAVPKVDGVHVGSDRDEEVQKPAEQQSRRERKAEPMQNAAVPPVQVEKPEVEIDDLESKLEEAMKQIQE